MRDNGEGRVGRVFQTRLESASTSQPIASNSESKISVAVQPLREDTDPDQREKERQLPRLRCATRHP